MTTVSPKYQICIICNQKDHQIFCRRNNQNYFRCSQCGHVYVENQASEHTILENYINRQSHHGSEIKEQWDYSDIKKKYVYHPLLQKINRFTNIGTLLDIGCSNGSFAYSAQRLNWDVSGIELEQGSRAIAQKHGLSIHTKPLDKLSLPSDHFDAVTMWQVIEHLSNPKATVQEVARILKPGGIFAVSTPNIKSIGWLLLKERWHCIEPEVHLNLFSPRGLEKLINDCGLKTKHLETSDIKPLTIRTFLRRHKPNNDLKASSSVAKLATEKSETQMKWLFRTRNLINIPLNLFGIGEDIFGYFIKE